MLKYLAAYCLATLPGSSSPDPSEPLKLRVRRILAAASPDSRVDDDEFDSIWPALASRPDAAAHIAVGTRMLGTATGTSSDAVAPPAKPVRYCDIGGTRHVWTIDCEQEGGIHDDCCCGNNSFTLFD